MGNSLNTASILIKDYFGNNQQKSFSQYDLKRILNINKSKWGISNSISIKKLISHITDNKILVKKEFKTSDDLIKSVYTIPDSDELTLFTALKRDAYFTHYSAMYLNELTLQIPKTHYLNYEHYHNSEKGELTQESIDEAFRKPQRKSSKFYLIGNKKIYVLNGMKTDRIGVIHHLTDTQSFHYTNLERTLIDISIRPVYSGGVFEVLNAYKTAKSILDVLKLKKYLEEINYTYPYQQVIGFYLEKAGYGKSELKYFSQSFEYDFYLTYDMKKIEYNKQWKIYYPKGF